jgi:ribosomal protein L20A (L18A)
MKTFNLSGKLRLGSKWNKFSKDITANDENHAKDLLFAKFGSKHKLPRRFINLLEVSETGQSTVSREPKNDKATKTTE